MREGWAKFNQQPVNAIILVKERRMFGGWGHARRPHAIYYASAKISALFSFRVTQKDKKDIARPVKCFMLLMFKYTIYFVEVLLSLF